MNATRAWPYLIGVLALAIYRAALIANGGLPQDFEEFYYLYWATAPDLGYFSKPPLLSWLLWVASHTLGNSELAIKSVALILHTATAGVIYLLGRRMQLAPAAAGMAAVIYQSLPIVGAVSLFSTTDAPLALFWALTLYTFLRARNSDALGWWLATGLCAGLGLLSKYSMGILAPGLLAYLLFSPTHRHLLRGRGLWLGALTAVMVLAPNLWWNYQHAFIAFRHTAEISQLDRQLFHLDHFATFLVAQIGVFGPILAFVAVRQIARRDAWLDDNQRLLLAASLAILGLIGLQALLARANINWAAPAYIGLSLFVTLRLWPQARRWLLAAVALNLLLTATLAYHFHTLAPALGIELSARTDIHSKRIGWRELGHAVRTWTDAYPDAILVSDSRPFLAYLSYFGTRQWPPRIAGWMPDGRIRDQYDLMGDVSHYPAASFLFLSRAPMDAELAPRFASVQPLGVQRYSVYPDLVREAYGYLVSGFRGY